MKSRRVFGRVSTMLGMALVLMLLTFVLAACEANFTPTLPLSSASDTPTTTVAATGGQAVATTAVSQLPTFTAAPTLAFPTVTPALPTNTAPAITTVAATTVVPITTAALTNTAIAAPPTTKAVVTTVPVVTTKVVAPPTTKPTTSAAGKISPVFNSVLPDLRRQHEVAVVLPTFIPGTSVGPVYAIIERSDKPGYSVVLGYTPDCTGGNACRVGTVGGQPVSSGAADLTGTTVKLTNGVTGYFVASTCGANCSDATLTWKQGQGVYTVGIKAGKLPELTQMANSAIAAGQI